MVIKSTGSWYEVKTSGGRYVRARLRGKLKLEEKKVTNPIAVGDHVSMILETGGEGIIHAIHPRKNYIIRKSTRKTAHGHIIAANIDQAVLIASLTFPKTSIGFIDRFLVSAESFRIRARIIFNKADLMDGGLMELHHYLSGLYHELGYDNILISATDPVTPETLRDMLKGTISLFSGHSGVGKSTILNKLKPSLELPVGEVSAFANKGIHTTTFATMYELDGDTFVIDTPGIKEMGLIDMEPWEISHYFPEMREKLGQCRFHNCLHINEPGCLVLEALERGEIAPSRYDSYISMMIDEDNRR